MRTKEPEQTKEGDYSFCECAVANAFSIWHIRKLTAEGKKCSGGIDSKSLCGRVVPQGQKRDDDKLGWGGWDLEVKFEPYMNAATTNYKGICKGCLQVYLTETAEIVTDGRTTWINRPILLGRFSKTGIDVHIDGKCVGDSCSPGPCGIREWEEFKQLMLKHHHIVVSDDVMPNYLKEEQGG